MRDVKMVIELKNGNVSVVGPIDDPLACYALLGAARDAVFMQAMEKNRQYQEAHSTRIEVPKIEVPPEFKKN